MKILLIVNNVFYEKRGSLFTFRAIGEFGSRLIELGHDVEMLQTKLKKDEEFHDYDLSKSLIKTTALKRYKSKLFTYFFVYFVAIWRVWRSDFVYIFYPTNYHYLAFVSMVFGKEYALNIRGEQNVRSRLSRILYRHAKFVFTVSPGFTSLVNESGGRGITQRPGISFNYNDIVSKKNLTFPEVFKILYLGRLDIEKGLIELIEAARVLVDRGIVSFNITIVGDGYHESHVKERMHELNLGNFINFYGPENDLERLKNLYKSADLFVLPTYHEGFPRTLYEAMIFGVPVLTTFVGGIPFLLKNEVHAIRIEPKSVDSLVEKLVYAFNNYNGLIEIVRNAEVLVRGIFDPERRSHADEFHFSLHNEL